MDQATERPLSEQVDDPQLSSALACVEATSAADDVPAWVGIELYNALDAARGELGRLRAMEQRTREVHERRQKMYGKSVDLRYILDGPISR